MLPTELDVRHLRRMARGEAPLLRGELLDVPPRDEDAGVYMSAAQHIEAVVHSRSKDLGRRVFCRIDCERPMLYVRVASHGWSDFYAGIPLVPFVEDIARKYGLPKWRFYGCPVTKLYLYYIYHEEWLFKREGINTRELTRLPLGFCYMKDEEQSQAISNVFIKILAKKAQWKAKQESRE